MSDPTPTPVPAVAETVETPAAVSIEAPVEAATVAAETAPEQPAAEPELPTADVSEPIKKAAEVEEAPASELVDASPAVPVVQEESVTEAQAQAPADVVEAKAVAAIEPAAEPSVEPTAEPVVEDATELTAEPTVEPTVAPAAESTIEPTVEPTAEATAEPAAERAVEPPVEATTEPAAEPTTEPAVEPTSEVKSVEPTVETEDPKALPETPAAVATESTTGWPPLSEDHALLQFHARLPQILEAAEHDKIWGVTLSAASPPAFSTLLILQKFLRSVENNGDEAAKNLEATLKWRKEFGLDKGEPAEDFGPNFEGLGYVTHLHSEQGRTEVVTWNVYGAVKDLGETFGDLPVFLRWRVGLMERALAHLNLATTTVPIPDLGQGEDPHRLAQVHVYTGVSFLRMDPRVKAASKATIDLMSKNYPETLSRKLFVGVPLLMSWVMTAVRVFVSAETARKFVVISYPTNTAAELGEKADVPPRFGGTGPELAELEQQANVAL